MGKVLSMPEIFNEVTLAATDADRRTILKRNETQALLHVLRNAFCPEIEFDVDVPDYPKSFRPIGTEYANLNAEARRLYIFQKGYNLRPEKKRDLLVNMLASFHVEEAKLLELILKKEINIPNLTPELVETTFPGLLSWKGKPWTPRKTSSAQSQTGSSAPTSQTESLDSKVGQSTSKLPVSRKRPTKSETKKKQESNSLPTIL